MSNWTPLTALLYVYFPFLGWVKFCIDCVRQVFFSFGRQKKKSLVVLDRWLSYTLTIAWKFAWADSALVVLDESSSYRGGCLNRLDCNSIVCYAQASAVGRA